MIDLIVASRTDGDDEHFDAFSVDVVDDPDVARPDTAAAGKNSAQGLPALSGSPWRIRSSITESAQRAPAVPSSVRSSVTSG
ncbi:MAG: hypothetical protein M5R42_21100 [Rhodocyclaceae bacterium]|nr:hypothetical protein [Rhodocyclaceae bacterium]